MDLPNPAELRAIAARYQAAASTIERIQQLRSQSSQLSQQADELEASLPSAPQAAEKPQAQAAQQAAASAPALEQEVAWQDRINAEWGRFAPSGLGN